VNLEPLRRILPYTAIAIALAAIYSGATLYSRYTDARDADQRAKAREAATNEKIVKMFGGDDLTILSFAAEPGLIAPGEKVEMCYGVSNAATVKIEPDAPPLKPAVTHCFEIRPRKTTRYTLTAADAQGHHKEGSLTIRVEQPASTPASDSPAP
jgi:hypothetical protein